VNRRSGAIGSILRNGHGFFTVGSFCIILFVEDIETMEAAALRDA
jgi:hypothetical protein